jgi:hypothetical protein
MAESIQRPGGAAASRFARALLAGLAVLVLSQAVGAHDIPASVVVRSFVKPEGQRLRVLLRLPLVSIRDFAIPARDGVLLDLPRVEPMLGDMVRTWVLPSLTLFEDGQPVGAPVIAATRISLPSDQAFAAYESAVAHFGTAPLDPAIGAVFDRSPICAFRHTRRDDDAVPDAGAAGACVRIHR